MLSDFPELDFRPDDNSGVFPHQVPARTQDTGVFRCRAGGSKFEAIIMDRTQLRRNGRLANSAPTSSQLVSLR
jgi:hypothetical protein